jgi:basic amino acid/polyamine antiporter, APA family
VRLWPQAQHLAVWLVIAPIIVLSLINMVGVIAGKSTQNLLSALKVIGLAGVVIAGVWAAASDSPSPANIEPRPADPNFGLALVFVLYAFGGWAHAAYVAAEVRDERRNLPRALMLGIVVVTITYVAVTAAYLVALGIDVARSSPTPAAEVLELVVGPWGGRAISLLVMLSALGAINGMILTGTRIYATLGSDYPAFAWLSTWTCLGTKNQRDAAPVAAIAAQAAVAVLLVLVVGTAKGRALCDSALLSVGLRELPWHEYFGGFETLVAGSAPVFWAFFLLTGLAVFVLRIRFADRDRPFRIPFFPLPPIVFCLACAYMLYSSLTYARWLTLLGLVPLAFGAILASILKPSSPRP